MSSKVCVPAWNEGPHKTKDAVTLAQLVDMVDALGQLGFDGSTPVTFLFDDDHVWLETVEFDDTICNKVLDGDQVNRVLGIKDPRVRSGQWMQTVVE